MHQRCRDAFYLLGGFLEYSFTQSSKSTPQPLCTAIQIMLVQILKQAGIEFSAVVSHSLDEIATTYTAEVLYTDDPIPITYHWDLHLNSISKSGAMMAIGASYEDVKKLYSLLNFEGRVCRGQ